MGKKDKAHAPDAAASKVSGKAGKKRRAESEAAAAEDDDAPAAAPKTVLELFTTRIKESSAYFDRLVALIPAKFYLTPSAEEEERNRYKHGAGEKAKAKQAAKENSKKAKRRKLDPASAKSTLEEQQERAAGEHAAGAAARRQKAPVEEEDGDGDDGGGDRGEAPSLVWKLSDSGVGTPGAGKADLQQRLQLKIEEARAKRKADEHAARVASAKQWKSQAVGRSPTPTKPPAPGVTSGGSTPGGTPVAALPPPVSGVVKGQPAPVGPSLQFGRIAGMDTPGSRRSKKATRDRVAALAAVEARQADVEQAGGAATAEGQAQLAKQSWQAALARASGEKVLDDPKLLKKSIKRAQKAKQQRAAVWEQRVVAQEERQAERQQKRKDNLQARTDDKVGKRIEKREKKLLRRPGFEGRKGDDGFLNK